MKEKVYYSSLSLFFIVLFFNCLSCINRSENKSLKITSKIDSLTKYYNESLTSLKEPEEALPKIQMFISGASTLEQDSLVYKGYMLKTRILGRQRNYKEAIKDSEYLLDLATKNGDSSYMGKATNKLGIYHSVLNNYIDAFKYYNRSFKIHRDLKDSVLASKRLLYMADSQSQSHNLKEQRFYCTR